MNSVGIIGFGRFGHTLGQILSYDFKVKAYDSTTQEEQFGVELVDRNTVLKQKTLFISVPIREFKNLIVDIAPKLSEGTTVIDVCSVKVYPVIVMTEALPDNIGIIATHPLFGPDSIANTDSLKIMMNPTRDIYDQFQFWKEYFESKGVRVVQMTPEEHDRLAAKTQGITHFIGRILDQVDVESTEIDTVGFKKLLDVIKQTCYDSWELFTDLQSYNPYTLPMIENLESAITTVRSRILRRN